MADVTFKFNSEAVAAIDPQRAYIAAELYNRCREKLIEAGWTEAEGEDISFKGWWWRNPSHEHQGIVSMDAALNYVAKR